MKAMKAPLAVALAVAGMFAIRYDTKVTIYFGGGGRTALATKMLGEFGFTPK